MPCLNEDHCIDLDEFVNQNCLCIKNGNVYKSKTFDQNLKTVSEYGYQCELEDACDGNARLVYNAFDYYTNFYSWCNIYDREQKGKFIEQQNNSNIEKGEFIARQEKNIKEQKKFREQQ